MGFCLSVVRILSNLVLDSEITMASLAAAAPSAAAAAHSLSANRMDVESESEVIEVDDDDDDDNDENIDEEQLEEYKEMVEQLGSFPVRAHLVVECCMAADPSSR
jgi:hypothetical protein